MKKNNGFVFLTLKLISSFKLSYFFEILSVFFITTVSVLVLSLMNGVQSNHISAIKYAQSFPIIVKNINKSTAKDIKNTLKTTYGCNAYLYTDDSLYTTNSDRLDVFILRKAEKEYYSDRVFTDKFELSPFNTNELIGSGISLSFYNPNSLSSLYFLDKGKSGSVVLKSLGVDNASFYAEKGIFSNPGMIYMVGDFEKDDIDDVNLGIFSSSKTEKIILKYLLSAYTEYEISSYKTERSDIYSALQIEKFFLFFVMVLMSFLILLTLYKTMYSIIKTSKDERMLLLAFGKTEKDIFVLYFFSLYIPVFVSSVIGGMFATLLIKSGILSKYFIKYFYSYSLSSLFITDSVQIVLYISIVLILSFVMLLHILKKNSRINMHEVSLDERDY